MEQRAGAQGTVTDGVFFTEATISGVKAVQHLHVEISRQNSNLAEIKHQLADEAIRLGANAVMNFKYGQRAHPRWQLILTFKWDTESWYGEGDAVRLA